MRILSMVLAMGMITSCNGTGKGGIKAEIQTTEGNILIELSDLTPGHRDNFIKLAESGFYDGVSFHRVIQNFMIQTGDGSTKADTSANPADYTIPAEINDSLFHRRGAVAAARLGAGQCRADPVRPAGQGLGPGGGDREQARRPERDRRADRGPLCARWLHLLLRDHRGPGHQPAAVQDAALRPGQGLRAGGLRRAQPVRGAGEGRVADPVDRRPGGPVQGQPGQAGDRQRRPAHLQRHDRAPVQCPQRRGRQPGELFGRGRGHAGPDRRPRGCDGG